MRTRIKIFLSTLILIGFFNTLNAQVSATGTSNITANIVQPVGISKTINSDFGSGAVIMSAEVEMIPTDFHFTKGNISLPISYGIFTASTYYFTGSTGYTYTISFPTSPYILKTGPNSMKISSLTNLPNMSSDSDMIAGVFVSITPSNVTVNYN